MNIEQDWEIKPRAGLGSLGFGMSSEDVSAHHGVYGKPKVRIEESTDVDINETLKLFGQFFSEAEGLIANQALANHKPNSAIRRETYPRGLSLEYEAGKLTAIMLAKSATHANLATQRIFSIDTLNVLAFLQSLNKGAGRFRKNTALFDNIAISLEGFTFVSEKNEVRPLPLDDGSFLKRTLELRQTPYDPGHEDVWPYVAQSFG